MLSIEINNLYDYSKQLFINPNADLFQMYAKTMSTYDAIASYISLRYLRVKALMTAEQSAKYT